MPGTGRTALALNCGSSSIKFCIFDWDLTPLLAGSVQGIGPGLRPVLHIGGRDVALDTRHADHGPALGCILAHLEAEIGSIAVAGHRVVHGGLVFRHPVRIDAAVRSGIESLSPLAPLHQPHNLIGIDALTRLKPDLPQVAVFDTAFHATIPEHRQLMPLPRRFDVEGLRRFGFHGISYQSIVPRLPAVVGARASGRVVICHLGNGCSLAGLVAGVCAYTSMGLTPLDGLVMGSRPGRLDPGAVLWLVERHGGDVAAVRHLLNTGSGLLGVSGISSDMRALLADSSPDAALAVTMFTDRLRQEIGSAAAAIGGIDALVFTGGIGENAPSIRKATVDGLVWLGLQLDPAANARNASTITAPRGAVSAHVIQTEEERMIAGAALLTTADRTGGSP